MNKETWHHYGVDTVNLIEIGQAAGPQRDQRTVTLDQTEQFRDAR